MKKIILLAMIVSGILVNICYAEQMSQEQINQAIAVGKQAAAEEKDFVYYEMDTDRTHGNSVVSRARAYALTPFCNVATTALNFKKIGKPIPDTHINSASAHFDMLIVFTLNDLGHTSFISPHIVAIQGNKVIKPLEVILSDYQLITRATIFVEPIQEADFGGIIKFNAADIDLSQPIEIKVTAQNSSDLSFKFVPQKDSSEEYKLGTDSYKF
jgi:hypothetical protein